MSLSQVVPTLALSRSGAVEIFIFPLRLFTDSRINNYIIRMEKNNKSAYKNIDFHEKIKNLLEQPSSQKLDLVEKIMEIYMKWEEEFFKAYPIFSSMGRPLYSKQDDDEDTSIETYLRGELLSYSEKTLALYLKYILEMKNKNINLAVKNMDNLASMQGFENSQDVENYYTKNSQL